MLSIDYIEFEPDNWLQVALVASALWLVFSTIFSSCFVYWAVRIAVGKTYGHFKTLKIWVVLGVLGLNVSLFMLALLMMFQGIAAPAEAAVIATLLMMLAFGMVKRWYLQPVRD